MLASPEKLRRFFVNLAGNAILINGD